MITIACSSSSMLEERIEVSNPGVDKQRRKSGLEDLKSPFVQIVWLLLNMVNLFPTLCQLSSKGPCLLMGSGNRKPTSKEFHVTILQDGPLLVVNGVITPINGLINGCSNWGYYPYQRSYFTQLITGISMSNVAFLSRKPRCTTWTSIGTLFWHGVQSTICCILLMSSIGFYDTIQCSFG